MSDNIIDTITTRGIDVDFQDGRAVHGVIISYNQVRNNSSTTDYLLKVNVTGGSKVIGNTFQGSLAPIAAYFQRATGDSTQYNIIENNTFRDCAGQAMHFQGLKRSRISGNVFDSLGAAALVFDNSTRNRITDNMYEPGTVVHATSANGNNNNIIEDNIGAITADNLTSTLLNNYPNPQQNITGAPRIVGQTAVSGANIHISNGTGSAANWIQLTPASRTISTTSPLAGGGALTGNLTLGIANAAANGTTKGAATFLAAHFIDDGAGLISLDTTNGPNFTKTQADARYWGLSGNAVTSGQFMGSTNNAEVMIMANNDTVIRVLPTGQVGIWSDIPNGLSSFFYPQRCRSEWGNDQFNVLDI